VIVLRHPDVNVRVPSLFPVTAQRTGTEQRTASVIAPTGLP